mmetsp:Transcript_13780/g.24903  ORF Transcript_13780/g.24903 Transcript_13780/m.24903 type:complete len:294 (+) Transcript_13780:1255-2136(+)
MPLAPKYLALSISHLLKLNAVLAGKSSTVRAVESMVSSPFYRDTRHHHRGRREALWEQWGLVAIFVFTKLSFQLCDSSPVAFLPVGFRQCSLSGGLGRLVFCRCLGCCGRLFRCSLLGCLPRFGSKGWLGGLFFFVIFYFSDFGGQRSDLLPSLLHGLLCLLSGEACQQFFDGVCPSNVSCGSAIGVLYGRISAVIEQEVDSRCPPMECSTVQRGPAILCCGVWVCQSPQELPYHNGVPGHGCLGDGGVAISLRRLEVRPLLKESSHIVVPPCKGALDEVLVELLPLLLRQLC